MKEPTFDLAAAHRWFAVELNNIAWDLIDKDDRTESDTDRMIHAAHASYWHWMHAGNAVNQQRALCLLACAYASAGDADHATRYAAECAGLSELNGSLQTGFDRATAFACAARAHMTAGNIQDAMLARNSAIEAAMKLDDEERRVVDAICGPMNINPTSP